MAIMIIVLAMVMFAATAFALDAGRLWVANRNLVTATDAYALAAASDYAIGEDGCNAQGEYFGLNAPGPDASAVCDDEFDDNAIGYVRVDAEQTVPFVFGVLVDILSATARSTTAVQVGPPDGLAGLRPVALCLFDDQIQNWDPDSGDTYRIPIENPPGVPGPCDALGGDFGWLKFEKTPDTKRHIEEGYEEIVVEEMCIQPQPGAHADYEGILSGLVGETITIVIFDERCGSGPNARYQVVGFAAMEIVSPVLTGVGNEKYIEVKAARMLATGTCCGGGLDLGVRAMNICEVRPDDGLIAANCTNTN